MASRIQLVAFVLLCCICCAVQCCCCDCCEGESCPPGLILNSTRRRAPQKNLNAPLTQLPRVRRQEKVEELGQPDRTPDTAHPDRPQLDLIKQVNPLKARNAHQNEQTEPQTQVGTQVATEEAQNDATTSTTTPSTQ